MSDKTSKSKNSPVSGEIIIDHSDEKKKHAPQLPEPEVLKDPAEPDPVIVDPAKKLVESETHVKGSNVIEPLTPESDILNVPDPVASNEIHSQVVVPGGVNSATPNPATFFKSKYRHRNAPHIEPTAVPQTGVFPVNPAPSMPLQPTTPIEYQQLPTLAQRNMPLIFTLVGIGVFTIAVIGYIFGVYIPSKPENAIGIALDRSGKAVESIMVRATEPNTFNTLKQSELSGYFESTFKKGAITGQLGGKFDGQYLDLTSDVVNKIPGGGDKNYSLAILSEPTSGSAYPNVYIKSNGFNIFGLDSYLPKSTKLQKSWVQIDSDQSASLGAQYLSLFTDEILPNTGSTSAGSPLNQADIAQATSVVTKNVREYVLTKNKEKGVFLNEQFIGSEELDNLETYRYSIELDGDHFNQFCSALSSELSTTDAFTKLFSSDVANQATSSIETGCTNYGQSVINSGGLEIWIDKKYKLVHKIRLTDRENPEKFSEVGQNYRGKSIFQPFIYKKDGQTGYESYTQLNVDLKNATMNFDLQTTVTTVDNTDSLIIKLATQSVPDSVSFTPPTGVKRIEDIIGNTSKNIVPIVSTKSGKY